MTAHSASRPRRQSLPLIPALAIGLALGVAVGEARADDTIASLMRDPHRLDAIQQGCKTNQAWATDAVCRTAAEAIRRRFRGEGVHYTPRHVDPFPSRSVKKPAPGPKPEARHQPAPARANRTL